jgi:hypothetical protein
VSHKSIALVSIIVACVALASCGKKDALTPEQVRAIAKEAYIYGFPVVDNYRVLHAYFIDTDNAEFKGPSNEILNTARVYTPDDKTIQTPNSDTPYSFVGADLRVEPLVITVPPVDKGRYYSLQFVDLYTHNFAYVGSRATGNQGGTYLLAGPGWKGEKPQGVDAVIPCETEWALVIYRTQLFNDPKDIKNVEEIQRGYKVRPLSQFLGQAPTTPPTTVDFMKPLSAEDERTSFEFFNLLNFVLKFCPTHPSEELLMMRFANIGVGAGKVFDATKLAPDMRKAIEDGRADAWAAYDSLEHLMATGELTSADLFGTREYLKNNYLYRMTGAVDGIYGNSKEEAIYPAYVLDSDGQKMDGSMGRYELRFAPGQIPPVNAFWSVTMYNAKTRMLVANPLERYLINSAMLPKLKRAKDGSLTIYIQYASPGPDRQSNWLPAPNGPFLVAMRLYWPKPAAFDGTWKKPPLKKAD